MGLLDSVLGAKRQGAGMSPMTMAVVGLLAYKAIKDRGGLSNILGLGNQVGQEGAATSPAGPGGLLGGISSLFGGSDSGSLLSNGLSDLMQQFRNSGQQDKADSWIGTGPNKDITATQLEQVLGREKIAWLEQHTGLPRDQLLAGLSKELPDVVDRMTPDGQIPHQIDTSRV